MDELKKLNCSRRGYKGHLGKLLSATEEVLRKLSSLRETNPDATLSESDILVLTENQKQLRLKAATFQDIDEKIIAITDDEEKLEAAVYEAADLQAVLSEKMALITHTLAACTSSQSNVTASSTINTRASSALPQPLTDGAQLQDGPETHVSGTDTIIHPPAADSISTVESATVPPLSANAHMHTPHKEPMHAHHFGTRLPKLEIPVFTGDPLDWQPFWDCFEAAIDTNPTLIGVQKLSYLRAQLRGEASRVITGLPLTNTNYQTSVTLLKDRYGQPQRIISAHVQALLDLPRPSNKLTALRLFYDTIETHVRCLQSLGKLDTLLAPIILTKLPEETKRNMARSHIKTEWTVLELQAALLNEIRIFETGQQTSQLYSQQGNPTASFYTGLSRKSCNTKDSGNKLNCAFCKGNHAAINCDVHKNTASRMEIIKQQRLCYNCLAHHRVTQCHSKNRCRKCGNKHHTSICNASGKDGISQIPTETTPLSTTTEKTVSQATPQTTSKPASQTASQTASLTTLAPHKIAKNTTCLLKTAIATVVGTSMQTEANILFDEGSQRSFLTEKLAEELALTPYKFETISLSAFGAKKPLHRQMDAVSVRIRTATGELVSLSALVVPTIATPISFSLDTDALQLPYLKGLPLAHPITESENFEVSLLIGADHYWDLVGDHIIRGAGPTAMSSKLGYLLSGPALLPRPVSASVNTLHVFADHHQEESDLTKFWQIEDTAVTSPESGKSGHQFLTTYTANHISRQDDGTYCAGFPWKAEHPPLPNNFEICQKRTRSLANRLAQSPDLLQSYNKILEEQLSRGFIERVTEPSESGAFHYIPHHAVRKNSPTTPIRIVYDCSCRQSREHPSLNDCLLTGPPFLNDLTSIILRFRTHQYGYVTDIEKAFLHIVLHEQDRNFTRFLWLSDPLDPSSDFATYRFCTVLFGSVSSPFMLFAVLNHHLLQYNTHVSHTIRSNLYVDNIVTGCDTEKGALQFYKQARSMLCEAKFNLRAWASNSKLLMKAARQDGTSDESDPINVLGISWNTATDCLALSLKSPRLTSSTLTTKRQVLKEASKLFDPLGITSPVSVRAKLFMQKLWQMNIEWDEPLDAIIREEWVTIINDIQRLSELTIDRRYFKREFSRANVTLHVFADASIRAYGAVAFLACGGEVTFVLAKNRVAPLKSLTLPKLELMAAVVASRIAKFISDALKLQDTTTYYWGDSQIVLHWLASAKPLPQFVQRRVLEIKSAIPGATWNFCPTATNPADLLTRGISTELLYSPGTLWWKGPPWLTTPQNWPTWQPEPAIHLHAAAAIAEEFVPQPSACPDTGLHQVIKLTDYSSLPKLLAVTAYTLRFINNLSKSRPKLNGPLTAEELSSAQTKWIKACQQLRYPLEMASAKSKCIRPKKPPLVRQLRLFIDDSGLLRCGGRIHNAPLSELARFPYLLPQNNHLTALIVNYVHVLLSHAGIGSTLTALQQSFWIPSGRQYVKKLLRKCFVCRRHSGRPYATPESPPLPKVRVQDVPPFSITGVDFTGALYVKQNSEEVKVYLCLFTCATSRAVHLEVVTDLSTTTFLLAFRRFTSRRSLPVVMMSDNASTYTSAADELTRLFTSEELNTVLGREGTKWQFIPKKAPWFGGYWERLIGLTKMAIKKTLGRAHINLETLQTVVVEVEAILNDRPLTYISDDITDPEPLTPAHILHGRRLTRLPHERTTIEDIRDPSYQEGDQLRRDAKRQSILLDHFTHRWRQEYLTSLREFYRPTGTSGQQVKIGDVVLVHDECPRMNWKLAVIEDLTKGNDGMVRSATIRTKNGITNRPVVKLYPLEVTSDAGSLRDQMTELTDNDESNATETDVAETDHSAQVRIRPRRKAAEQAQQRILEWTGCTRAPRRMLETD